MVNAIVTKRAVIRVIPAMLLAIGLGSVAYTYPVGAEIAFKLGLLLAAVVLAWVLLLGALPVLVARFLLGLWGVALMPLTFKRFGRQSMTASIVVGALVGVVQVCLFQVGLPQRLTGSALVDETYMTVPLPILVAAAISALLAGKLLYRCPAFHVIDGEDDFGRMAGPMNFGALSAVTFIAFVVVIAGLMGNA